MGVLRINPIHETEDDTHVFRIFGNLEQYSRGVADENNPSHGIVKNQEDSPTREFVENWLKEKIAPLEVQVGDTIIWSTFFRINERMANGFRRNRAFLVGGMSLEICNSNCILKTLFRCRSLSFSCRWPRHEFGYSRW